MGIVLRLFFVCSGPTLKRWLQRNVSILTTLPLYVLPDPRAFRFLRCTMS
jgi:hypothetical protein